MNKALQGITDDGWKNYRMSFQDKAKEIVDALTLEEKISLMGGSMSMEAVREAILRKAKTHYNEHPYLAGGMTEKGIPAIRFADGSRGVVCGRGRHTCFPVAAMRAASFDIALEEQIGEAIGEEVLAAGGNLYGGVCVNLPYHPGWGRAQETYGEDTYLLGEMGAAMIRGVQKKGVIACVKHFAFNSMEDSRFEVDITCSKRAEREVFLPQFKRCIEAGAGAVMSAYNSYQTAMCGHNNYLLNTVLKKEWGFDGFVLSDFNWGVKDTVEAANGGMDLEMPNTRFYGENLLAAVQSGRVEERVVDEAALRIVRTSLAYEQVREENAQGKALKVQPLHTKLALQCAREGITLLRNEKELLPLKRHKLERIVVLGSLADKENTGDKGSSAVYAPYIVSALSGITKAAKGIEVIYYEGSSGSHCKRLAKQADAVIIIAGNDYHDEGEHIAADGMDPKKSYIGGDRKDGLGLKSRDLDIIEAVAETRDDAIIVLFGGSTITMADWIEKTGAVLYAYYPGMEGGTALGETLFGQVNPSGKLPFVIPGQEVDLPEIDWSAKMQTYDYYHGYTLLDKKGIKPLFPFGFGLSYTSFMISKTKMWQQEETFFVKATIENTGTREGAEVVQVYVSVRGSHVERPVKILAAFKRVLLKKGERQEITLSLDKAQLAYYDEAKGALLIEPSPAEYELYIGTSSAWEDLKKIESRK